ncbi:hypothetical protein H4Q26_006542 [Puccinia striiformis f. sp. tritici PST-130]|nr:hypothetical protein Pst134EB_020639 [Puccinia striiformis f. sp. tritici]KAH9449829.1 hypothetical protein Pst134EB_020639 [Puccinia striiformis f. sp. tritici]KAI9610403.1 hypothetical protein H4Q26_006542 [Puccinia striiformis f. sp. tritici PST-130]
MPSTRPSVAGPGAIGDREGGRRNSWEPWTTDVDSARAGQDSGPQTMSIKAAGRRASEFSTGGRLGANGRAAGSPLARHRLSAVANLSVPEIDGTGTNFSALRRASQPAYVPFSQATDSLTNGMGSLSMGTDNAISSRASFNAGAPNSAIRNAGLAAHRPSLPGLYNASAPSQPDGGWNPYYFGSQAGAANHLGATNPNHDSPSSLELSAAVAYGQGYDYRRDSGYGPSPPIVSSGDARRDSYASQITDLNNIRRTQSAWHIHDAFAAPQIRHSSFSFMPNQTPGIGAAGLSHGMHGVTYGMGANGAAGYGGHFEGAYNPSLMSMDSMLNSGHLLTQQQLLAEARRQSINLQNLELNGYGNAQYANNGAYSMHPGVMAGNMGPRGGPTPATNMAGGKPAPVSRNQSTVSHKSSFDSGRVSRSAVLEEFRSNKHRRWELKDMTGLIVEFAGDQLGSRHIQSKLDTATPEEKTIVFEEIYPHVLQLSMDVFANYVVQKFFEQGNEAQKAKLADSLRGHVLQLSLQMYGCRVIQKALEFIQVPQQHLLIKELEGEVIQCAKDQNANHVLQRSLERIDCNVNLFISKTFTGQAFALATHPYGCRVLQKVFEHMPDEQTKPLLEELHRFSNNLMTDQYGNYVAQWIITDGKKEDAAAMLAKVQGQVLLLSKHKFASNVVEKAILKSTDEQKKEMIDEILAVRTDGTSTVGIMLKDAFANFPLQKFLQAAKEPQRTQLFAEVGEQLADMKKYSLSYGKYLVAIEKLVNNEKANVQFNTNISLSNSLTNNIAVAPAVTQIAV